MPVGHPEQLLGAVEKRVARALERNVARHQRHVVAAVHEPASAIRLLVLSLRITETPADQTPVRGPRLGEIFVGSQCKIEINRNKFTTNPPDFVKDGPDLALAKKWEGAGWIARDHVANWIACIKSRATPNADVEIGHRTVTIGHVCNIVRQLGRSLRWEPATERFPDDAEANALVDRPRRVGWELPT